MRQLRSEVVYSMSEHALEILGIDGKQSDYREGRIDITTHPAFCQLRKDNKFLGAGDNYFQSSQLIRASGLLHLTCFSSDTYDRDFT